MCKSLERKWYRFRKADWDDLDMSCGWEKSGYLECDIHKNGVKLTKTKDP